MSERVPVSIWCFKDPLTGQAVSIVNWSIFSSVYTWPFSATPATSSLVYTCLWLCDILIAKWNRVFNSILPIIVICFCVYCISSLSLSFTTYKMILWKFLNQSRDFVEMRIINNDYIRNSCQWSVDCINSFPPIIIRISLWF